jgi:hypothetical protein
MSNRESLLTPSEIETTITYNYEKLLNARERGEKELESLFESRMNRSLDEYQDCLQFGSVALSDVEVGCE